MTASLPFRLDWIQYVAEHRDPDLTSFFRFWSLAGEIEGYVLVVALIFAAFNKRLGARMAVIVLLAMTLNHVLKTIIQNPRPFIDEGNWLEKWAVPPDNARELAAEFSTPSGHAMAAAAAYSFLALSVKDKRIKALAVTVLILTGLSRPYLGVHYVEDIMLGWMIGLGLALLDFWRADQVSRLWGQAGPRLSFCLCCAAGLMIWSGTIMATSGQVAGQPDAFLAYLGFLAGLCIALPLEKRWVDFDPASEGLAHRLSRWFVCTVFATLALSLLDAGFARLADDDSLTGDLLRFVRYALASVAGFFLAPLLFARTLGPPNFAEKMVDPQ